MRIFISGPMTGQPDDNFPAFRSSAAMWRLAGHEAIDPSENGHVGADMTYNDVLGQALVGLLSANAIALLPGHQDSLGSYVEKIVARALGYPVYDALSMDRLEWAVAVYDRADVTPQRARKRRVAARVRKGNRVVAATV